ncbi:MAG: hypothetical protein ACI9K5_002769 [Gammaproteobacteria bacterium]|jgi:hypothetical protein
MPQDRFGGVPNRRAFLSKSALAGLGLFQLQGVRAWGGSQWLQGASSGGGQTPLPRAKALIHIFLPGGMAHQDTFDPKPYAPVEYRGDLEVINTSIAGVRFAKRLQHTAKIADKLTVIRSFNHGEAAHERGQHNMLTCYRPNPAVVYPSMGSVIAHELGVRESLPPYVWIPTSPNAFGGSGFLSASYAPFTIGSEPSANGYGVRDLNSPGGIDGDRVARRRAMLEQVNAHFGRHEEGDGLAAMDDFYRHAFEMLSSESARAAFDLNAEEASLRDEYGRNAAGQRLLLARRLVESGVRYATVTYGGWDMHQNIQAGLDRQMPNLDRAFAALIRDLDRRGLLDSTLVLMTSEFGRTPRLNNEGGRDHWPGVFSVVMAGGGVKRGYVHGSSDALAAAVETDGVGPADLGRTIFTLLGVDPDKTLMSPGDRPVRIVYGGRVIKEILA